MDTVRVVPGARRGFQAVASTYVEKGDPVIVTSLAHYTEFMAVEAAGGIPRRSQKMQRTTSPPMPPLRRSRR